MDDQNTIENAAILLSDKTSLPMDDLRLLLSNGWEAAQVKDMLTIAKRSYVMSHHDRQIFRLPPSKNWKNGCFKTYVYVDSKRKEITASTNDILYEKLYSFYKDRENKAKTLEEVFDMFADYKQSCLNRSDKTISADYSMFSHVSKEIRKTAIRDLTDEHIRRFIVSDLLPKKPKPAMLKRLLQLLRAVFEYGIRNKLCFDNPLKYIVAQDYYKYCDQSFKTDEEKAFSEEELAKLASDAENNLDNPRVLMALLAAETGMRIGELCALHAEDIDDEYIHVHRQQVNIFGEEGQTKEVMVEVPYTKDERLHPHNGRFIPLTTEARRIVSLAKTIPGESPYLFHDCNDSGMILKNGYIESLRRRCKRLGCVSTNNHAFRMAFNSRLIEMGFSPSDRALILGHEVQTNEAHYSLTDKRRLERIKNRLNKKEP